MARIQEYLPEQSAAEPQGGASANLNVVDRFGEGVEQLGRGITETANVLENRASMMEAADAQEQVAGTKADFFNRVQDETKRGILDQNTLLDDYDNWASDAGSKFSTPRGRAEFERASGRTRGSLIRWAAQGSAQIAGANEVASHTNAMNISSNIVMQDPSPGTFANEMGALDEKYNGYENDPNMNKNPAQLQAMKKQDQTLLADSMVKGVMQKSFDAVVSDMVSSGGKLDPRDPRYNAVEGLLNHVDPDTGKNFLDDYLNADQKAALIKQSRANFNAAQTEGNRVLDVQKIQNEAAIQNWQTSIVPKMAAGTLSTKEIISGAQKLGMTMEATQAMLKSNAEIARLAAKGQTSTPPTVYNDINSRILNGQISSPEELMKQTSRGLTGDDYKTMLTMLDKTPQGRANLSNEKSLIEFAKEKINSANGGQKYAGGELQLMQFTNALQQAKQSAVNNGKSVDSVLNPSSPDFFGKNIQQYMQTPADIIKQKADEIRGQYNIQGSQETKQQGTTEKTVNRPRIMKGPDGIMRQRNDSDGKWYPVKENK